jgi:3-deoxy-manno-octulosonate cytidylyltransferase (CMP-KDO synthetase)
LYFYTKVTEDMKILGLIPARFASTRFPGKPLAVIGGKTMLEQVYLRCVESKVFSDVYVATDNEVIAETAKNFGAKYVLTDPNHPSGTDRCFEALSLIGTDFDAIINVQGDEPFIDPKSIQAVAKLLKSNAQIASLGVKIEQIATLFDENKVKIVLDSNCKAIYFSRAALPFQRGVEAKFWLENTDYYAHLGIYGFNTSVIPQLKGLKPSKLELLECLEQLRWLESGFEISIDIVEDAPMGVDTPKDLELVNELLSKGKIKF